MGDIFQFQYSTNKGAFLGLGARLPESVRFWSFIVLVSVALVGMLIFLYASQELSHPMSMLGVSLMIGGGLSNLIDRLLHRGAVVDFLNMGLGGLRTGIFNLADVAIMIGAGMLLAWSLFLRGAGEAESG
jgi:signal peptidase II